MALALAIPAAMTAASLAAGASAAGSARVVHAAATTTPIQHVVVIMEENHSFDNYFGTFPGADGIPAGVCAPDPRAHTCDPPYHSTKEFTHDLPHFYDSAITDVDNGKMDGFVIAQEKACNCTLHEAMSYYDANEIPVFWRYARTYTLQDNLFESVASWSYPSHLSLISDWSASCTSTTNPLSCTGSAKTGFPGWKSWPGNQLPWTDLTWLLHAYGVSWGWYVADGTEPDCDTSGCVLGPQSSGTPTWQNVLPWFTDVQQDQQLGNIKELASFYSDVSAGNLPAVTWVIPNRADGGHPFTGNTPGSEQYVVSLVNAIESSPAWNSTAIVLAWDDWGGEYDHVVPPQVDSLGFGLRVPGMLISPYAKQGTIDHQMLSFDAYNKFIEDNFLGGQRLDPKTDNRPDSRQGVREANPLVGNLMSEFDFTKPPAAPILFPTVSAPPALTRGSQASISGAHFQPGDTVRVVLNCGTPDCAGGVTAASAIAAPDGTFTVAFSVPSSVPSGHSWVSAEGTAPLTYFGVTDTSVQ